MSPRGDVIWAIGAAAPLVAAAVVTATTDPVAALAIVLGLIGLLTLLAAEYRHRLRREHQALHDPLTGLANRDLFHALVDAAFTRCARAGTTAVVLVIDLDGFKQINDAHGHGCGDLALCAFARRLDSCVRAGDIVARLGGDEFGILLVEPATLDGAQSIIARLREDFAMPVHEHIAGRLALRASIGAAELGGRVSPGDALTGADAAMYADKRSRRGQAGRVEAQRGRRDRTRSHRDRAAAPAVDG